jgi:hypothetical protein
MGTDHTGPVEIQGTATFPPPDNFYDTAVTWRIEYKYENGVTVLFTDASQNPQGFRIEGTEGWIFKPHSKPATADPESLLESVIGPDEIHLCRPLRWDPQEEQFIGDAEAEALRSRSVRPPWSL